jgi:hypothetical protein
VADWSLGILIAKPVSDIRTFSLPLERGAIRTRPPQTTFIGRQLGQASLQTVSADPVTLRSGLVVESTISWRFMEAISLRRLATDATSRGRQIDW